MNAQLNDSPQPKEVFPFRVHRVKEVSVRYFPHLTPNSGTRALRRIIYGDPELLHALEEHGYVSGLRTLTPAMLNVLVSYLGTPHEFSP